MTDHSELKRLAEAFPAELDWDSNTEPFFNGPSGESLGGGSTGFYSVYGKPFRLEGEDYDYDGPTYVEACNADFAKFMVAARDGVLALIVERDEFMEAQGRRMDILREELKAENEALKAKLQAGKDRVQKLIDIARGHQRDVLVLRKSTTDWQAECLKKGFEYVRESDDHYVLADVPEMALLLGDLLGVEVRDKENHSYGETVSSLNEQIESANNAFHRAYEAEKECEELRKDKDRLDALESNFWDVRHSSHPIADTGDSSSSLEIVGHWMDKPFERVIGEDWNENLRAAIDQAMKAPAYPPARPEYEFDEIPDFGGGSGNKARRRAESMGIDYDAAMRKDG